MMEDPRALALDQLRCYLLGAPPAVRAAPAAADRAAHARLFELVVAHERGLYLWQSLPMATFERLAALEVFRYDFRGDRPQDYGIDCASADCADTAQAKWYGPRSFVRWEDVAKFHSMSVALGARRLLLAHGEAAKIRGQTDALACSLKIEKLAVSDARIAEVCALALGTEPAAAALSTESAAAAVSTESAAAAIDELDLDLDELAAEIQRLDVSSTSSNVLEVAKASAAAAAAATAVAIGAGPANTAAFDSDDSDENPDENPDEDPDEDSDEDTDEDTDEDIDDLESTSSENSKFPLYRWQKEAVEVLSEALNECEDESPICCNIACGAGKSRMILELIDENSYLPALVIVPAKTLLHQFRDEVARWKPHLSLGLVGDGLDEQGREVTVCTYNSVHKIAGEFDLLVVDEAHHMEEAFAGDPDADDLKVFSAAARGVKYQRSLLVSATLETEDVDYAYGIDDAVADGTVVDYNLVVPVFDEGGNKQNELARLIRDHSEWTRVLAYCNSVESAAAFATVCCDEGLAAETFDGTTSTAVRAAVMARLSAGETRVLATVNTLGEGVDIREADTCMFVEPRRSRVNVIQCVGRVQRKSPATGKTVATVVLPAVDEEVELARFIRVINCTDRRITSKNLRQRLSVMRRAATSAMSEDAELLYVGVYERLSLVIGSRDDWDFKYNALLAFVREHGRLPKRSESVGKIHLGNWIQNQRNYRKKNQLSADRVKLLEEVPGWFWKQDHNATWRATLDAVLAFVREHDRLPKKTESAGGLRLANWIGTQRQERKKGRLSPEKSTLLEAVPGWDWGLGFDMAWRNMFDALHAFVKEHGHLPKQSKSDGGRRLGVWIGKQRQDQKKGQLSAEKATLLEAVPGWFWEQDLDGAWHNTLDALLAFVRDNGRLPKARETAGGERLGMWISDQRKNQKKGQLSADRVKLLEEVPGWFWERDPDGAWCASLDAVQAFVRENGRLPKQTESAGGLRLGAWVSKQRQNQKKGQLSADRAALLEEVSGWFWEQDLWRGTLDAVFAFVREHGRLPNKTRGELLGAWVNRQKIAQKKDQLTADKISLLETIPGWEWSQIIRKDVPKINTFWRSMLNTLHVFVHENGRLPKTNEIVGDLRLGTWIHNQRASQKKGQLSAEKATLLEAVPGWEWGQDLDGAWRATLDAVHAFVREHGRFPKETDSVGDVRLGTWISKQRLCQKKGQLAADRVKLLEDVPGWFWEQDLDAKWRATLDALLAFVREQGRLPKTTESAGGVCLGTWITRQRTAQKKGQLAAERATLLEAVPGWFWEQDYDATWRNTLDALQSFVREHGRLPKQSESAGGLRLGAWVNKQRQDRKKGRLAADRVKLLEEVPGWRW